VKPDVIVSWPESCDYPLWRQFIRTERSRFAKVIVAFTAHPGPNYVDFVREAMNPDDVTFLDARETHGRDWRDVAVNAALDVSDAEWVWFTEQDFFITDPDWFWSVVDRGSDTMDAVGIPEPGGRRAHPACLFVKRTSIEHTDRYFGTEPIDHFGAFADQLAGPVYHVPRYNYEHLQGLSQNHWLVDSGIPDGRFKMDRFAQYLADCMAVSVPLNPTWAEGGQRYLRSQAA
jgi:hypothetical protein